LTIRDVARNPLDESHNTAEFLGYRPPVTLPFNYDIYKFFIKAIRDDDRLLGNELLKRLLMGSQADFERTYNDIRSILKLWNYLDCPARFLPEMLMLLGFTNDTATTDILVDLPEIDLRRLAWAAAKVWKRKGTELAYDLISSLLGGVRLEIDDWFYFRWVTLDDIASATPEGILGEDRAPDDPWIVASPGLWTEPSEYMTDIVVMDEPWIELNRDLVISMLKLTRPSSERLDVAFVEYLDHYADDSDVEVVSGGATVADGELTHDEDDTLTVSKVDGASGWEGIYIAWQVKVSHQERSDPDNEFRLVFNYADADNYDYVEVDLGVGTGRATVLLGRRLAGSESTLASGTKDVDLDLDSYYVWRVQETKYFVPGTSDQRQQVKVLQDQDPVLLYDEAVGPATPVAGNVGERSGKARVTVTWKEAYQAPLTRETLRHIRPTLRIEPHYAEVLPLSSMQFSSYGGGGRNRYSMVSGGSGGIVTPDGLYTSGAVGGTVDRVRVTDRFCAETTALIEVSE